MAILLGSLAFANPPDGLVAIRDVVPGVTLDIRYATADNFTGAPLPGYERADAWLLAPVAVALRGVAQDLAVAGFGIVVWDGYRPKRATDAMVAWATRTHNEWVVEQGFVARKSEHNKGLAIDLGLTRDGHEVDLGAFDSFGDDAAAHAATGEVRANRLLLARVMTAHGFAPYAKEWWHFSFPRIAAPALDVPY
jgi:zinc D-Ala-D-Ala dipeptidase